MPLIILKRQNQLEKVRRICAEFTKMVNFLAQNSDNPRYSNCYNTATF